MVSRETSQIRDAIRITAPVGLGMIPLGLAFGLVVIQAGFSWWWAPVMSILIYAGSMEFLAVNLITAGVGPISAAITGFLVNFRHIFYGLTYPRHRIRSKLGRAYSTYALTDEAYAIASTHRNLTGTQLLVMQVMCQLLWVLSGTAGALFGHAIPQSIEGMEFALTSLFVVLAWESFGANKDFSLIVFALLFAGLALIVAPGQMLIVALLSYFAFLLLRNASPTIDRALTWKAP